MNKMIRERDVVSKINDYFDNLTYEDMDVEEIREGVVNIIKNTNGAKTEIIDIFTDHRHDNDGYFITS